MKRRPLAPPCPASEPVTAHTTPAAAPAGGTAEKTWHVDEPSGVPAPVIRANMISFRRSYQGRIKVAFFEQ